MIRVRSACLFLLGVGSTAAAGAAQVTILGGGGTSYGTPQAAVDAAADRDLLVVQPGAYPGFTVDGKALTIVAGPGVTIGGTVTVRNLPPRKAVVLQDLAAVGPNSVGAGGFPGLRVEDCAGSVRFQDCSFTGGAGEGNLDEDPGGPGALVAESSDVVFTGCMLQGGLGGEVDDFFGEGYGGVGGAALESASSRVAVYASQLTGGKGGDHRTEGGKGGAGASASASRVFVGTSTLTAGDGGFAGDSVAYRGGDGGDGMSVQASSTCQLLDVDLLPGEGGESDSGDGAPGIELVVAPDSSVDEIEGHDLLLDAPALVSDAADATLTVLGEPGTDVRLFRGRRPGYFEIPGYAGVLLLRTARLITTVSPFATIDEKGRADQAIRIRELPAGPSHALLTVQVHTGAPFGASSYPRQIAAARVLIEIDDGLGDDCNANGVNDLVDLSTGTSFDCDLDFVPDECSGSIVDCNSNGIPDPCDLRDGTSLDQNGNEVPDECEAASTYYVDDDALPGGDGSLGAPFDAIGPALLATSVSGDEIVVLDGTYTGASNSNLDLPPFDITLRSANGPSGCVIDLLQVDGTRAFQAAAGTTRATRIEGFTIQGGRWTSGLQHVRVAGAILLESSSATVSDCVFVDNWAYYGGAISGSNGAPLIEDCSFQDNRVTGGGWGGAVFLGDGIVRRCSFESNVGFLGGAVRMLDGVISHSVFLSNTGEGGGAIAFLSGAVDNCLIAGNSADRAGAITGGSAGNSIVVSHCVIVDNEAAVEGGALRFGGTTTVVNSILWGNVAPSGPQIDLVSGELTVAYSDIEGGQAAVANSFGTLVWGAGNLDVDPAFVDPDGADDIAATVADNDYRLGALSPSIDAGSNGLIAFDAADIDGNGNTAERVQVDLDGNTRRVDDPAAPNSGAGTGALVDMGAYEREP